MIEKELLDSTTFNVYLISLLVNPCSEYSYQKPYALFTNKEIAEKVKVELNKLTIKELQKKKLIEKDDWDCEIGLKGLKVNNIKGIFNNLNLKYEI